MEAILDGMEILPQFVGGITGAEITGVRLFCTLLYGKSLSPISISLLPDDVVLKARKDDIMVLVTSASLVGFGSLKS